MSPTLENRWCISAELTTCTPLHIGIGDTVPNDKRVEKGKNEKGEMQYAQVSAVATDANGKPWLPGAGLRGALRAWLEAHFTSKDETNRLAFLFGPEAAKRELTPDDKAGALAVFGASFLNDLDVTATTKQSYWSRERSTTVETGVAIDRVFGVASDKKLYYREVVPAGVRFQWELAVYGGDENDIKLLLAALDALGRGETPLGADSQDGKGEVRLENLHVILANAQLQKDWIDARLKGSESRSLKELAKPQSLAAAPPPHPAPPPATLAITLNFDGLFCVNDPGRVRNIPTYPNTEPMRTGENKPLLPASSFRGVLRSHCERIGRTLGMTIHGDGEGLEPLKTVRSLAEVAALDCVSILFGVTGWRGLLCVKDFVGANPMEPVNHELVAIDRFTGSVSGDKKFKFAAYRSPSLTGSIKLESRRLKTVSEKLRKEDRDNLEAAWLKGLEILARALCDLTEGDLRFGMGAAKGYGYCRATFGPELVSKWLHSCEPSWTMPVGDDLEVVAPPWPETEPSKATTVSSKPAPPNEFHNPYQFIPLAPPDANMPWHRATPSELIKIRGIGRDRYLGFDEDRFSGRLLCRMTLESPVVIGAWQDAQVDKFRTVHPLTLDKVKKRPYIPGSSLRGMIGSVVEAATSSAMRILANRPINGKWKLYDYFRNANLNDFLPYGPERESLSPAELLLGTASDEKTDGKVSAMASRLTVSDAHSENAKLEPGKITLRILTSQKPVYPSFYYLRKEDSGDPYAFTPKASLTPSTHKPRGRKQYLHGLDGQITSSEWKALPKELAALKPNQTQQYAKVTPIAFDPQNPAPGQSHESYRRPRRSSRYWTFEAARRRWTLRPPLCLTGA